MLIVLITQSLEIVVYTMVCGVCVGGVVGVACGVGVWVGCVAVVAWVVGRWWAGMYCVVCVWWVVWWVVWAGVGERVGVWGRWGCVVVWWRGFGGLRGGKWLCGGSLG